MTTLRKLSLIVFLFSLAPLQAIPSFTQIREKKYLDNALTSAGIAGGFGYLAASAAVPPLLVVTSTGLAAYYGYRTALFLNSSMTGKPIDDKVQTWVTQKAQEPRGNYNYDAAIREISEDNLNLFS